MIQNGNLQFFISGANSIEERVKQMEKTIRNGRFTADKLDMDFQSVISKTHQLIKSEDAKKPLFPASQSAQRLVKLIHVKKKIVLLSKHLKQVNVCQKRIKQFHCSALTPEKEETAPDLIASLNMCINELTDQMKASMRLPFNADQAWESFYQRKVRDLRLDNSTIKAVQKDLFHLMANQFARKDLQGVDVEEYEGSLELQATISYLSLLEELRNRVDAERLTAFSAMYETLKKAEAFAVKTSFAHRFLKKEDQIPLAYLKDLACFDKSAASFYHTNQPPYLFQVPFQVLVNDMCWDMIDMINHMRAGDKRIFNLGTGTHSVVIQIELLPPTDFVDCRYCYTIFNTGNGIKKHHVIEKKEQEIFVRPYIIKGIRREQLSYSFIESLIVCALDKRSTVDQFYSLHSAFLFQKGVEVDLKSGPLYKAQQFDTCAYACLEAWIDLQLTEQEVLEKEMIKVSRYLETQRQIIELQERQL